MMTYFKKRLSLFDDLRGLFGAKLVRWLCIFLVDARHHELAHVELFAFSLMLEQITNFLNLINCFVRTMLDDVAHDLAYMQIQVFISRLLQVLL
jgi:hypothetical protein